MSITYLEAIRAAQERALDETPNVFIYGQDLGNLAARLRLQKTWQRCFPVV
jgi:pyruvate/2-oxoglutarate/acetoin dehydrogenase E1 component